MRGQASVEMALALLFGVVPLTLGLIAFAEESARAAEKRMSDLAEYYQLVNLERCQKPDRKGGQLARMARFVVRKMAHHPGH